MDQVSLNVTYAEAVKSSAAIRLGMDNVPDAEALENMQRVAGQVFERIRYEVCGDKPLAVTSFFRSPEVNRAVGGTVSSQHCRGEAMDVDADVYGNGTNRAIFDFIRDRLAFDQLIWEFGDDTHPDWVHVSLCAHGNRHQVLRSFRGKDGKTVYELL